MRRQTLGLLALLLCLALPLRGGADITDPAAGGASLPANVSDWTGDVTGGGNDQYTILLLPFEDTTTTWRDESQFMRGAPAISGATADWTTYKFGEGAANFTGGQTISYPASKAWFLEGDFAIDCWVRWTALPTSGNYAGIWEWWTSANDATYLMLGNSAGVYTLYYKIRIGSSDLVQVFRVITPSINTWYHIAVTRDGTDYRMFLDGVQQGATVSDVDVGTYHAGTFRFGLFTGTTGYLNGRIDEFRITDGDSRWTAGFTVPAAAYGRVNLHLEGADGLIYPTGPAL